MRSLWRGGHLLVLAALALAMAGVLLLSRLAPAAAPAPGQGDGPDPSDVPMPTGYVDPEVRETKPDFLRDYVFLFIGEQNLYALKGFPVWNPVRHAATFNEETRALYLLNRPERATPEMKAMVLTEAITPEALLFSRIHVVEDLPWTFAFPELTWQGVYAADPAGKEENMVDNARREVRGEITLEEVREDGTVVVRFGGESRVISPNEPWVIAGPKQESQLVIYSFGLWSTGDITYGETVVS